MLNLAPKKKIIQNVINEKRESLNANQQDSVESKFPYKRALPEPTYPSPKKVCVENEKQNNLNNQNEIVLSQKVPTSPQLTQVLNITNNNTQLMNNPNTSFMNQMLNQQSIFQKQFLEQQTLFQKQLMQVYMQQQQK